MLSVNHPVPAAPDRSGRATRGTTTSLDVPEKGDDSPSVHGNLCSRVEAMVLGIPADPARESLLVRPLDAALR